MRFHASNVTPPQEFTGDIPIVQKVAHAYKVWHSQLQHFPRLSRYTLGAKIDTLYCETLELILLAGYSSRQTKLVVVERASTKLDALKFFLQTAWEMKVIDTKRYGQLTSPLIEVGKMLGGWRKQLQSKTPPT
jgi:hypothetical protein